MTGAPNLTPSAELLATLSRRPSADQETIEGYLSGKIATRRAMVASGPWGTRRALNRVIPRQRQRSPDREASRHRRRTLGGSSSLPDTLRHHYTEGQRAVLCIVAGEVKRTGVCDFPIDKIAALAGVCRTTVQTTMHEARRLGHIKITERPLPGRKSLPNIVEVVSREWLAWLKRGPSGPRCIGSNSLKIVSTTKTIKIKTTRKKKELAGWRNSFERPGEQTSVR